MQLRPPRSRHGHAGLVYVFREDYEPSVRNAIDRFIPEGATVFDIGANIGLWSLRMARLVGPNGCVIAFEPMPDTASQLERNATLSRAYNVTVQRLALGDSIRDTTLYIPSDAGRASLAPESHQDTAAPVQQTSLDTFWISNGRERVPFVKIDIEGAEPLALDGAQEFFRNCRPVVTCELNTTKLARLGFDCTDILDRFRSLGYGQYRWDVRTSEFLASADSSDGDALFIPNEAL